MPLEYVQRIREKYPEYADMSDQQLAGAVLKKYPEYQDVLGDVVSTGMPETSLLPRVVERVITPVLAGAVEGTLDIPRGIGAAASSIGSAAKLDLADIARHPSQLIEAMKPIPGQMKRGALPIAGAIVGGMAGPLGIPIGASGGEFLNQAIEQLWTGQPKTVGEVAEAGVRTGVSTAVSMAIPGVARAAMKLTGRGAFRDDPAARAVFERQGVEPTAADVSGSRAAAITESGVGRLYGGAGVMQQSFEKTVQQVTDAFQRAKQGLGTFGGREVVGRDAVREVKATLKLLDTEVDKLKTLANQSLQPGDFIGSDNLRQVAKELYDEILDANPGLRNSPTLKRLEKMTWTAEPAIKDSAGNIVRQARDLTRLNLNQWWANNKELGVLSRSRDLIANIPQGRAKDLYKATMLDLEDAKLPATQAVKEFKRYYREEIVPFNESLPGELASGQIKMEDVGSLLSRRGISQIDEVRKYAPNQFDAIRNRWLGDEFSQANIIDTQKGFQPAIFRTWWNKVDPEVRAKLFDPATIRNFDDLAFIAERTGRKFGPNMGGGMSGTPSTMMPLLQAGYLVTQGGQLIRSAAAGDALGVAVNVGEAMLSVLGPYGAAKLMTSPGGIRHLTRALQIPAGSREGMAILSRIGIAGTRAQEKPQSQQRSYLPKQVKNVLRTAGQWGTAAPMEVVKKVYESVGGDRSKVAECLVEMGYDPRALVE